MDITLWGPPFTLTVTTAATVTSSERGQSWPCPPRGGKVRAQDAGCGSDQGPCWVPGPSMELAGRAEVARRRLILSQSSGTKISSLTVTLECHSR